MKDEGAGETPIVDVRPEIAAGGEPLERILSVAETVPPGGSFLLLVPFEPVPLRRLLSRRGFTSECERLESGDFLVRFKREGAL